MTSPFSPNPRVAAAIADMLRAAKPPGGARFKPSQASLVTSAVVHGWLGHRALGGYALTAKGASLLEQHDRMARSVTVSPSARIDPLDHVGAPASAPAFELPSFDASPSPSPDPTPDPSPSPSFEGGGGDFGGGGASGEW